MAIGGYWLLPQPAGRFREDSRRVDLWVYWSPETGELNVNLPGRLHTVGLDHAKRDELPSALQVHAHALAQQLG